MAYFFYTTPENSEYSNTRLSFGIKNIGICIYDTSYEKNSIWHFNINFFKWNYLTTCKKLSSRLQKMKI